LWGVIELPTAIEIFKYLPKKNCGKCNYPTCLAFAMQIANAKAKLEDCPFVPEEAKSALAASAAPPIRLVKVGSGKEAVEMGDETELYRHERKFFHPIAYAIEVSDSSTPKEIEARVHRIANMSYERVGQILKFDMIAVRNSSKDPLIFAEAVEQVSKLSDMALVLISDDAEAMRMAVGRAASKRPLLFGANKQNYLAMCTVAKASSCPLVVSEPAGLDELADLVAKIKSEGIEDVVLDIGAKDLKQQLEMCTIVRKVSVKKIFRGLGYPMLISAGKGEGAVLKGLLATMKYGSLVVFEDIDAAQALSLFVLRQNIFTDPQVPIQVKPGIYAVNGAKEDSPLLFTTNFSLTYFTVLADIEKSRVPAWLLVVDTEGLSVMTAFSAGKLTPESVVKGLEASGAKERSKRGEIIIPGMVTRMSGKLQEAAGLKVIVGPKESSGLPKFLKNLY